MKNKGLFDLKTLNKYYIKQKENEIKRLDAKKLETINSIESETLKLMNRELELERLKGENEYLKDQLVQLKRLILNGGVFLNIENKGHTFKEWENLLLYKKNSTYVVCTKKGEELQGLDEDYNRVIEEFFKEGFNYSLVVVRVGSRNIKVQLRFVNKSG